MHVLSLYLHTQISTVIVKKIIAHDFYHIIETIKICSSDHCILVHFIHLIEMVHYLSNVVA